MSTIKKHKCDLTGATLDVLNRRVLFSNGVLSQWSHSPFRDPVIDVGFSTAEQAMMYWKARKFNDFEIADKILQTRDPKEQKALGRLVQNYDDNVWAAVRLEIVANNNFYKFTQNPLLTSILLAFADWEFVEASPWDKIWGVGLAASNDAIFDAANWQGLNLLGKAIKIAQNRIITAL